jgi:2-O-methyltransferase
MKFLSHCIVIVLLIHNQLITGDVSGKKIQHISKKASEVFNFIKPYLPNNPVILEAGAFDGTETKLMSQIWPLAQIHAFEPVPELFQKLKRTCHATKNINTYQLALSDKEGFAEFHISEWVANPGVSLQSGSLLTPKEHLKYASQIVFPKKISVETISIDQWAKNNKVDHVDFMWLDMQGHELTALKYALSTLAKVKLIYTEVEFVKAYEGQALYKEVREWLCEQGFEVLAIDFDEKVASLGDAIPVGDGKGYDWFGNVLFIKKDMPNTK